MLCLPQVFQDRSGRAVTCPVPLFDTLWQLCLPQVFQGRSGRAVTCPVPLFDTLWRALLTAGVPEQVWQVRDLSCTHLQYSLTRSAYRRCSRAGLAGRWPAFPVSLIDTLWHSLTYRRCSRAGLAGPWRWRSGRRRSRQWWYSSRCPGRRPQPS